MKSNRRAFVCRLLLGLGLSLAAQSASGQTTAFTYQGRLTDSSLPATGTYDMKFSLFDAPAAGAQVGATVTVMGLDVTNGLFTVALNEAAEFGAAPFDGADRYLEIAVRLSGDPGYTTLSPRQRIAATPYASRSNTAGQAQYLKFIDNRAIAPASSAHGQMQYGFTSFANNNTAPWADYLLLNSFTNAMGGNDNLLSFSRSSIAARLWQQSWNSGSAFSSFKDFAFKQDGVSQFPNDANYHTGSGTTNTLARFTGASTLGTSSLSDDGAIVQTPLQIRAPIYYDRDNTGYYVDPASTTNTNNLRFNVVDCINGTCPPNAAIRMTPNFHLNSGAGYAVILNWDNGTTGANKTFRVGSGQGSDAFYVYADGQAFTANWWRSLGNTGWLNETYGGGWYMNDSTYIRAYNNKAVSMQGGFASGPAGVNCGGMGGGFSLRVCGTLRAEGDITIGTGTTGCVQDADGTPIAGTCSSDARLKTAITPFPRVLDSLNRLQPVSFLWRASDFPERKLGTSPSFGLVAQDVEKVLPELVTEDEQGYKAVRYNKLPFLMLEGIKELKEANDALRQDNQRLSGQVAALRTLVCQQHPSAEVCR
jgi:hypothetical protein